MIVRLALLSDNIQKAFETNPISADDATSWRKIKCIGVLTLLQSIVVKGGKSETFAKSDRVMGLEMDKLESSLSLLISAIESDSSEIEMCCDNVLSLLWSEE